MRAGKREEEKRLTEEDTNQEKYRGIKHAKVRKIKEKKSRNEKQ